MATLFLAHGGDMSFLNDMAVRNMHRISSSDMDQLRKEEPDIYHQFFAK